MRPAAVPFGPARAVRTGLLAAALTSLASCAVIGRPPAQRMESFEITSTPDANSCGKESGNSLYFRVLQVSDPSPLEGLTLEQVWDNEEKVLGPALLEGGKHEDFIDAGSSREFKLKHNSKATAIVVVGNFCKTAGTCWRIVHPASDGLKLNLKVDASCLSETKR